MILIVDLFNDSLEDSIEKFYKIFNITEELMILYSATFGRRSLYVSISSGLNYHLRPVFSYRFSIRLLYPLM